MSYGVLALEVSSGILALGAITGMTYGILAVGLVFVYRSSKVINFAHGEIGAFGAAVCGVLVVRTGLPYWVAFAAGIATSALVGAVTEVAVVRRLRDAPRLMSLVATLGTAQFLLALSAVVNSQARSGSTFPQPSGMPEFRIGGVFLVTRSYSAMLLLSPAIVLALVLFLRRSRYGLGLRASAANVERARMAGIPAARMSTVAWALAGAVAAYTTVLIIPTRGFITAETLGPTLLLRALAAAVLARMTSLPIALGAGVVIGVVDQVLVFNYPTSGVPEIALFGILAVALLMQARGSGRAEERKDWAALQPWLALPEALRRVWVIRNLGRIACAILLVAGVIAGLLASNSAAVTMVAIVAFTLIGLSLGVVTGLAGQLSLGQFALAGVGATASYVVVDRFGNFLLALVVAAVVAAAVSMFLGLPALRVRGLLLGVITLSFALASQRWLLAQSWALGDGKTSERPVLGAIELDNTRRYYFWALAVLVLGFWLASNVWRGAIGLRLRAVRDNEDGARAFGISATAVKLEGFAIAGLLVGLGGAVYGHLLSRISAESFDVVTSINVVALSVLGGIGLLSGPLLGALYIVGLPRFVPLDNAGVAATSLGWLLLILYFPGGIAALIAAPRARLVAALARRAGIDTALVDVVPESHPVSAGAIRLTRAGSHTDAGGVVLRARGVVRHYGGIRAVDGVDLTVERDEIVGLIGPNGAGKTTLFEVLGGFTHAQAGTVELLGRDVTRLPADARARAGLVRSFQDAALFPTLTVNECVTLAFERLDPTNVVASLVAAQAPERAKRARAEELVALMGLARFRDRPIRELSTGTRRIAELACTVALEPVVLLLDEPSSGIAQRESEALGEVLLRIREHLGCALVVVEHDIPLLMGLATRVVALDTGSVIAEGTPDEIRQNPLVVASYLGTDSTAIERSGAGADMPEVARGAVR